MSGPAARSAIREIPNTVRQGARRRYDKSHALRLAPTTGRGLTRAGKDIRQRGRLHLPRYGGWTGVAEDGRTGLPGQRASRLGGRGERIPTDGAGILTKILGQHTVEVRKHVGQRFRIHEEGLGGHREELADVGGGIGIQR